MHINICIIGAGALGLLFAGKCSLSNERIRLVTHSYEQCRVILQKGLQLIEGEKKLTVTLDCFSFDEHPLHHIDWIFLMVKQQHIDDRLIHFLKLCSIRGANILCFQNGIGHVERLADSIPRKRIFTAVTTEAALKESPYRVKHTGKGITWIGHGNSVNPLSHEEEKNLMKSLQNAGFTVNSSKNINNIIWNKLLINAVINPLTAILKVRNGELIRSFNWLQMMKALYDEGRNTASAAGAELSDHLWDQLVEVCKDTALNTSSMLQDILEGRTTEIEWINGSIIRIAEQRQIMVPTHRAVYHMIKGIEPSI